MKDEAVLPIDALVHEIQDSAKYRHVCPDLIRRIGSRELANRRNLKEAVKETKNTLHQIAGAFLDPKMRYDIWLQQLQQAAAQSATENKDTTDNADTCDADTISNADTTCCVPTGIFHPFLLPPLLDIMTNHASTRERLPLLDTFYAQTLAKDRACPLRAGFVLRPEPARASVDAACARCHLSRLRPVRRHDDVPELFFFIGGRGGNRASV